MRMNIVKRMNAREGGRGRHIRGREPAWRAAWNARRYFAIRTSIARRADRRLRLRHPTPRSIQRALNVAALNLSESRGFPPHFRLRRSSRIWSSLRVWRDSLFALRTAPVGLASFPASHGSLPAWHSRFSHPRICRDLRLARIAFPVLRFLVCNEVRLRKLREMMAVVEIDK
jgi:hypothetical protein